MSRIKAELFGDLQPSETEGILLQYLVPAWDAHLPAERAPYGALAYKAAQYRMRMRRLQPDLTTQLAASRSPRRQVILTQIRVDNLMLPCGQKQGSARVCEMALAAEHKLDNLDNRLDKIDEDDSQDEHYHATLPTPNLINPSWPDQKVSFYVGGGDHMREAEADGKRHLPINVKVLDEAGVVLAHASVDLRDSEGATGFQLAAPLTKGPAIEPSAQPTVSFAYQIGPWLA